MPGKKKKLTEDPETSKLESQIAELEKTNQELRLQISQTALNNLLTNEESFRMHVINNLSRIEKLLEELDVEESEEDEEDEE